MLGTKGTKYNFPEVGLWRRQMEQIKNQLDVGSAGGCAVNGC
jgi:hypothetical protein